MPGVLLDFVATLAAKGCVDDADVLVVRRAIYGPDGLASRGEAEALISLDRKVTTSSAMWSELYVEALSDYVLDESRPEGYVDEALARWLIGEIQQDGRVRSATELELLVKVLEKAISVPPSLAAFALSQVKHAVLHGDGALVGNRRLTSGVISEDEVTLLRRILYAAGGGSNVAISRAEAEVLFDLNDATVAECNAPSWSDLFVKAIAGSVMVEAGHVPAPREGALAQRAWLDGGQEGVGAFMTLMATGFASFSSISASEELRGERQRRREEAQAASEVVSAEEASWLANRIGRHGTLHENERALLRFIKSYSPNVHPTLRALADKAA